MKLVSDSLVLSSSKDSTIRIWSKKTKRSKFASSVVFQHAQKSVNALALHPVNHVFGSASEDGFWRIYDIDSETLLASSTESQGGYNAFVFHPDGALALSGLVSGGIELIDVRSSRVEQILPHGPGLTKLDACENGFQFASGDSQGLVKLWDVRKVQAFQDIREDSSICSLSYSPTGHYLGIGSSSQVKVYSFGKPSWSEVASFSEHKGFVTGIKMSSNLDVIASVSLDKKLMFHGAV